MPAINVRLAYRPVRVGFLVRAGVLDDIRLAARLATLVWGGAYDPLLPVADTEQAARLVELFHPDVLYPVVADELLDEVVAAHPHLSVPHSLEFFRGFAPHDDELPFLDVRRAISALNDKLRHEDTTPWVCPAWEDDEANAHLYAVLYGEYGPEAPAPAYLEWFMQGLRAGRLGGLPIPGLNWTRTPLGVTAVSLEPQVRPGGLYSDGVVFADPDNADDLALYWNLRAGGVDVAFWPRGSDDGPLVETACAHVEALALAAASAPERRRVELYATTQWPRDPRLQTALKQALAGSEYVLAPLDWETFHQPLHVPDAVCAAATYVLGVVEDDGYGNRRLSAPLPELPLGGDPELFHESLICRVAPIIDGSTTHTLTLPFLPDLNPWYERELTLSLDGIRVETETVGLFVSPNDTALSLRLPRQDAIVRRVLARAGVEATPSAAGRAVAAIAEQLGGLQGTRVLRAPGVRQLLRTPKWRNWETTLGTIEREGLTDQRQKTASDVLESLLERGALVAALKIQCPHCTVRERYTLDQLGESMRCSRCRHTFAPAPLLHASSFEYAASGFFADEGAHGAVPVLLTMMRLAHGTSVERFIVPNHELGGIDVDCESDLLLLEKHHDGRLAVAVSECKGAGEIDQRDLDNLAAVADRLHASGVECYLIFTTLRDDFSDGELARFRTFRDRVAEQWSRDTSGLENWRRPAPILLTPRELGQWDFYTHDQREHVPHRHLLGLRELAANSEALYLD